jgi:hypothetical protein
MDMSICKVYRGNLVSIIVGEEMYGCAGEFHVMLKTTRMIVHPFFGHMVKRVAL